MNFGKIWKMCKKMLLVIVIIKMVKIVNSYKGKTVEELQKIPNDELLTLLNSRQST